MGTTASTTIRVLAANSAEAARAAADLRRHLLDAQDDLDITREKEQANTQDMGATLVMILGTQAVVVLANGIADWMRKRRIGSTVELEINGNRVALAGEVADNPKQVERLIRALNRAE